MSVTVAGISTRDVLQALGKAITGFGLSGPGEDSFSSVVTDSRRARPGCLFVALKGQRADGHNFASQALAQGARGLLLEKPVDLDPAAPRPTTFLVDNTLNALQRLATYWREKHEARVVGVTGSVGKSSTKELIASVLSVRYQVLKSEGNLNTEVGLPLVLLNLDDTTQQVVLEMGMYGPGEIRQLCQIARPQVGVITNVGHSHLERLGTLEAIAQAKAELVEALPEEGVAILNGDDPLVRAMAAGSRARVLLYGLDHALDLWAEDVESRGLEGVSFLLRYEQSKVTVRVRLLGRHSVHTALAAAAVGLVEGLTWEEIGAGLEKAQEFRLLPTPGLRGSLIIDDTYNASPSSTLAALDLLKELQGRRIAVLGDMRELGLYEVEGHLRVGRRAAQVVDLLLVVGEMAALAGKEAEAAGTRVIFASSREEASAKLLSILQSGDVVLVKGSRAMEMEEIVERLREK
ncbi:MAG: UDP-N-acetylmuramoyl-tripeptide--D-alanyl-D-alanine ligase [Dehalococcoidia bacterium]|nr:UDP-N-acetylmuramoyl-tripeptide--D-alanyl-D-alanine ligase [Dehalococcoidia bacterium]